MRYDWGNEADILVYTWRHVKGIELLTIIIQETFHIILITLVFKKADTSQGLKIILLDSKN